MKRMFQTLASAVTIAVGYKAGMWLWDEVLHNKFHNLKKRLSKKD